MGSHRFCLDYTASHADRREQHWSQAESVWHWQLWNRGMLIKGDLPGTPKDMGPPYGKRDPYYSRIFRDSCGSGMGIVWVRGPSIGCP